MPKASQLRLPHPGHPEEFARLDHRCKQIEATITWLGLAILKQRLRTTVGVAVSILFADMPWPLLNESLRCASANSVIFFATVESVRRVVIHALWACSIAPLETLHEAAPSNATVASILSAVDCALEIAPSDLVTSALLFSTSGSAFPCCPHAAGGASDAGSGKIDKPQYHGDRHQLAAFSCGGQRCPSVHSILAEAAERDRRKRGSRPWWHTSGLATMAHCGYVAPLNLHYQVAGA